MPKKEKQGSSTAIRIVSLLLALAVLGFLGWLIRTVPNALPQSGGQLPQDNEQLANLDQINPPPLIQEVESSPRNVSAPPPRPTPPPPAPPAGAKQRTTDPPPKAENRPPDLPPPAPSPKEAREKKVPASNANGSEADSLGERLVKATPEQQKELLEKLRRGKGAEYTLALTAAIKQLSDEAKEKARQTLADRLTRFTAKTLLAYLGDEDPELRRASALAIGMKDYKDHISELIDLLEDPDPTVVDAAHAALKSLTGEAAAAEKQAEPRARASSEAPKKPSSQVRPSATDSRMSRENKQNKDEDVPDVSLVPPEETSPEVKAIIKANAIALHSNRASERIHAAEVLGGLGEAGKPARRLLCAAMLDRAILVRVAAADALKNIDPKMHYLAVVLSTEKITNRYDAAHVVTLLKKIQRLEEDGEPLAPLVAYIAKFAASNGSPELFTTSLTTLSRVGRRDLSTYRVIATALTNRDPSIRAIAMQGLAGMKHGKLAVPRILVLLKLDVPTNRIAAMNALAALADESTEEIIADAIAAQRYHDNATVREAVESALNRLENKQTPKPEDTHAKQTDDGAVQSRSGRGAVGR